MFWWIKKAVARAAPLPTANPRQLNGLSLCICAFEFVVIVAEVEVGVVVEAGIAPWTLATANSISCGVKPFCSRKANRRESGEAATAGSERKATAVVMRSWRTVGGGVEGNSGISKRKGSFVIAYYYYQVNCHYNQVNCKSCFILL